MNIDTLKVLAVVVNTILFFHCLRNVIKGKTKSVYIVLCEYYGFFILPIMAELIYGPFQYRYYGFAISSEDTVTNFVTYMYLLLCPFIIIKFGKSKTKTTLNAQFLNNWFSNGLPTVVNALLWVVMASPVILALFSNQFTSFLNYGWVSSGTGSSELIAMHSYIFNLSFLVIIAAGLYSYSRPSISLAQGFWMVLLVFFAVFVNGKRNIVALTILILLLILIEKGWLRGKRIVMSAVAGTILFLTYSVVYQYLFRGDMLSTINMSLYENMFMDLARQDRLRIAIYSVLNPEMMRILEYPGQSILSCFLFFIPRTIWPVKPYPYHIYFTQAALIPNYVPFSIDPKAVDWGITTGWLDESIANFGWIGMLVGPLTIAFLCRWADNQPSMIKWFSVFIILLMLRSELSPVIMYFWLLICLYFKHYRKKYLLRKGVAACESCLHFVP